MDTESINTKVEMFMKENSIKMISVEEEDSLLLMEMFMKETLLKVNSKELEDMFSKKIITPILDNGKVTDIMEKESTEMEKEKLLNQVSGKKMN